MSSIRLTKKEEEWFNNQQLAHRKIIQDMLEAVDYPNIGQTWCLRSLDGDPFPKKIVSVTIKAVSGGWVLYDMGWPFNNERMEVERFINAYHRQLREDSKTMTDEFGTIIDLPDDDKLKVTEKDWFEKGVKQPSEEVARSAAIAALSQTNRRRADWAYNPNDVFICPDGHLQYNLNEEELDELRKRNVSRPPLCYDGGVCRNCTKPIEKLTADPKELQGKLGTSMMQAAALRQSVEPYKAISKDMNLIAMFLRENYQYEIAVGQSQHDGSGSKAVIHYLRLERSRVSVQVGKFWRAIKRLWGIV